MKMKKLLIIATVLVIVGFLIFRGMLSMLDWDFGKLSTAKYATASHEVQEPFHSISIQSNTAEVEFVLSDGKARVECYEQQTRKHSVSVQNDTLVIAVEDNRAWYEYIGFNFNTAKITVYLPEAAYESLTVKSATGSVKLPSDFRFETANVSLTTGSVAFGANVESKAKIKTTTGNIRVEQASVGELELSVTTGHINVSDVKCQGSLKAHVTTGDAKFTDVTCGSFRSTGSTGDLTLKNVVAAEKLTAERSTGDVKFDGADAAEIWVETDTGDVTGTLLSDKIFFTETDTGSVSVPRSTTGGKCEITTDTGDIRLKIQ